jgi:non-specific serine/threonine protein kinase/serine/threonine-protein kinase
MSAVDHDRLTAWFLGAVARHGESRIEFMARLRCEEPELLAEVESLLRHDAAPPAITRTGGAALVAGTEMASGARVGAYRILRLIGEGGMGVVYLAEQCEPLQRVVALKLMKPGFESLGTGSRFEAECRALERLDHPNIARVLDAGIAAGAGPYVVMEHVRGEPITQFADRRRLDLKERLRLFLPVCDALHHAHQNAIVHRDVKPSNVLVAEVDGGAVPKVIDFGIATALLADSEAASVHPEERALIGTPGYMSPEHAGRAEAESDVRSDVYSLGCLLYELLCGYPPFDPDALRLLRPHELGAFLVATDPVPASGRPECADACWDAICWRRRTRPRALIRRLRGDLDRIVGKALARERADRYASAHDLGADVRRFLNHQPIDATMPTVAYRFKKLVRRHHVGAAVVAVGVPLIIGFAIVMAFQAHRIAIERDRAEAFSEYLLEFYQAPLASQSRYGVRDPREVLFGGLNRVRRELRDNPIYAARMDQVVGDALRATGKPADARPVLEDASAQLAILLGREHPITLGARRNLAKALRDLGRGDESKAVFTSVLVTQRSTLGPFHPETLLTMRELGELHKRLGENREAALILAEARSSWLAIPGDGGLELALVTSLLGSVELELGRLDDAQAHLSEAITRLDEAGNEKCLALYNLACTLELLGKRTEALEALRRAVDLGWALNLFADAHLASLHHDPEFEALSNETQVRSQVGSDRLVKRAEFAIATGRPETAERLFLFAIDANPSSKGFNGFRTRLGDLYLSQGRWAEAEPLIRQTLDRLRQELGPNDVAVGIRSLDLAQIRLGQGDTAGATNALEVASAVFERCRGLGIRSLRLYAQACGQALAGRRAEALASLDASVEAGFDRAERFEKDLALRSLRDDPKLLRLIELMRRRYELS